MKSDNTTSGADKRPQRGLLGRLFKRPVAEPVQQDTQAPVVQVIATHGISNLRRLRVDDVAIPKVDIIAVSLDIGKDALVAVFREHGFSRLPVYKGTLDSPQGLILLKDLALQHGFGPGGRFSLRKLLRPILYAPPSMPVGVLLQKMQRERVHMALVIDEYGGVDGLVTIEDLIETVIGEIEDEHDEEEDILWKEEKPGVFLAQATAPLEEFEPVLGVALRTTEDDQEIDTLGGLVMMRTGRMPARGEIVPHESGAEFEVVDADPRRIKRIRVRLPGAVVAAAAEAGAIAAAEAAAASTRGAYDAARASSPGVVPPKGVGPKSPTLKIPTVQKVDAEIEAPRTPDSRTPGLRPPEARTPDAGTPVLRTPDARIPNSQTPRLQTPDPDTPDRQNRPANTPAKDA